jgi:hypothetical protein
MSLAKAITRETGGEWTGQQGLVPGIGHSAKDRSMAVKDNDSGDDVICHSFAGDDPLAFKDEMRRKGLLPSRPSLNNASVAPGGSYVYRAHDGATLFRVVRKPGKKFVAETPDGQGGWRSGLKGAKPVPYRLPELIAKHAEPVYIVEGEKDADNLARLGLVATTNPFGAGKWPSGFAPYFEGRTVFIIPDNDEPGRQHAAAVARILAAVAESVATINLPGLPDKGDVSDWIEAGGTAEQLIKLESEATKWTGDAPKVTSYESGATPARLFTAFDLGLMQFPDLQEIVPGVLVEGLSILAGAPKLGKSFAAMDIAIAVATGGKAFGSIGCEQGDVLYLALEDGKRRLKTRLQQMLPFEPELPRRLTFATEVPQIGEGLDSVIEEWIASAEKPRLIWIDTWRCVKPEGNGKGSAYDEDVRAIQPLHTLTKRYPGLCVGLIHHTRKAEADDIFATVSGTYGLTGVADTLLVLAKHGEGHKLCVRGRDIEDAEKSLKRNQITGAWTISGDARELAKTSERQQILDLLVEAEGEVLRTSQIAKAIGKKDDTTTRLLKGLLVEGLVEKAGFGKWRAQSAHSNQSNHSKWTQADDDTDSDFEHFE